MKLTNKLLGTIAMLAAPFLFLEMTIGNKNNYNSSLSGVFDLIYMVGWMCSMIGFYRMQAVGTKKTGNILLQLQFALLFLANTWNLWVIFDPANKSCLFFALDMCWPLSNLCLLAIGTYTAIKGSLNGWRRFVLLIAGLWLPVAFCSMMIFGRNNTSLLIGGIYSTVAWFILGWTIYSSPSPETKSLSFST